MSEKVRELQAARAKKLDAMKALHAAAEAADRDFTADEQIQFDALKAEAETLGKRIARAQEMQQQAIAAPGQAYQSISVGEDLAAQDPRLGFQSLGEFARAVRTSSIQGARIDPRLNIGAAAPGTYSNEGVGEEGGFLVPPQYAQEVWQLSLGDPLNLLPMTENTEVGGNSMVFPKDETTPWGTDGIQTYWQQEATAVTATKLKLGTDMLRLHKLMTLVPVTEELAEDASAIGSYLAQKVPAKMMWKINEAILFGTGAGQPKGCLISDANSPLVVQAKESAQTNGTIVQANISKMVSRLLVGELGSAVWIANPDVLPALEAMTVGNYPIYLSPIGGLREAPYGLLKGRPVLLSEHADILGNQSDISLVSLRGYRTITKAGGIQTATSMHLYFDAAALAFRWTFRIDGAPILRAPVTPPKSTNTRSYFVTLGARTS